MPAPPDASRTPSLALVIQYAIERRLTNLHTGLPGRVERYDATKQTVDVLPLVMGYLPSESGTPQAVPMQVLTELPVSFPAGGGMRQTFPLAKGDTGWIMFAEASLDVWQARGGLVDPGDQRRFHLSDAIFLPGLHADPAPLPGANATDATFGKNSGHQVVVTPSAIELGGNAGDRPTDFVALASLAKAELQALRSTVDSLVSTYNTHTHITTCGAGPGTAAPTTSSAAPPAPIGEVKSAVVKSK